MCGMQGKCKKKIEYFGVYLLLTLEQRYTYVKRQIITNLLIYLLITDLFTENSRYFR